MRALPTSRIFSHCAFSTAALFTMCSVDIDPALTNTAAEEYTDAFETRTAHCSGTNRLCRIALQGTLWHATSTSCHKIDRRRQTGGSNRHHSKRHAAARAAGPRRLHALLAHCAHAFEYGLQIARAAAAWTKDVKRGLLATRAPHRPNQLSLSALQVTHVDAAAGRIGVLGLDLLDGTPVLDVKPYVPPFDSFPRRGTDGSRRCRTAMRSARIGWTIGRRRRISTVELTVFCVTIRNRPVR